MKKLIISFSFLVMATATFAGNNQKAISPEKRLDATIQNQIAIPHFITEQVGEHSAELHFKVRPDGHIAVTDIVTDESDLKENLLYQALGFTVNTAGLDLSSIYKVVIRFNVIGN